jgi:F420 biosynthesis protein FbiB-like protein
MKNRSNDYHEFLLTRRSIRRFKKDPISKELVNRLIEVACRAPSAHNYQPWRFIVLSTQAERDRIAHAMGECLRADRNADGDDPIQVEKDVDRSIRRILGAPEAIIVCLALEELDRYPDERRSNAEYLMGVQSVAMAGQNLLLAAHASGLGAVWVCPPLFAQEVVRDVLDLPATWEPQGMVLLGYAAEEGRDRDRKRVDEVTLWR